MKTLINVSFALVLSAIFTYINEYFAIIDCSVYVFGITAFFLCLPYTAKDEKLYSLFGGYNDQSVNSIFSIYGYSRESHFTGIFGLTSLSKAQEDIGNIFGITLFSKANKIICLIFGITLFSKAQEDIGNIFGITLFSKANEIVSLLFGISFCCIENDRFHFISIRGLWFDQKHSFNFSI